MIILTSTNTKLIDPIPCTPLLKLKSRSIPISDATAKKIFETLSHKKQVAPTAKQKLSARYPDININWEKVYSLFFRVTVDSKIREFQNKVLNDIVYTNEKLFRFGPVKSLSCTFCRKEWESLEHLLFLCNFSSDFWKHVLSWLKDNNIQIETFIMTDAIFGKLVIEDDFSVINHVILLGKYYLYQKKCNGNLPSFCSFITRLKRALSIELFIARRSNKLTKF